MTLDDGTPIEAGKNYKVAGWATVGSKAPGPPIWAVVAEYLKSVGTARVDRLNTPLLKGITDNLGISDYPRLG
jgi:sulfur-oxidizing protein SoxB